MCYHIAQTSSKTTLAKTFAVEVATNLAEYHHVSGFEHPYLPIITTENPKKVELYEWGLIPHWCKEKNQALEMQNLTLNAKSETVFEKASFKSIIGKQRCLVLIDGFYEWQEVKKKKYPYYIYMADNQSFTLGGVYDYWLDRETGELKKTFSILTTEANPLMAKIHNTKKRMPLIIPSNQRSRWLSATSNKIDIQDSLQIYAGELEAYTISKLISQKNINTNVPEIKQKFEYAELILPTQKTLF